MMTAFLKNDTISARLPSVLTLQQVMKNKSNAPGDQCNYEGECNYQLGNISFKRCAYTVGRDKEKTTNKNLFDI